MNPPKKTRAMKNMMRHLSLTVIALAAAALTGCEKEHVMHGDATTYTATVKIGGGNTKELAADGMKTFAVGDKIAVVYTTIGGATVKAESEALTAADIKADGKVADFSVELADPDKSQPVTYIYPAAMAASDGTVDYDALAEQDGTLASLASGLDLCTYTAASWGGASLPANVTLVNQLAICKFTVNESAGGTEITSAVTALTVSDGTNTYSVSRTAAAGPVWVAVRPVSSGQSVTLTATTGDGSYLKTVSGKTFASGNIYPVSVSVEAITTLAALKSAVGGGMSATSYNHYLGYQVDASGNIAATSLTAIGYVGYINTSDVDQDVDGSRILVLASEDASASVSWGSWVDASDGLRGYWRTNTAQGNSKAPAVAAWNYSASQPDGASHWFMPTMSQLQAIINALGGYATFKTKVGWANEGYWMMTSYTPSPLMRYLPATGSYAGMMRYDNANASHRVRSCFAY